MNPANNSSLRVNLRTLFHRLLRLGFHALLEHFFLGGVFAGVVFHFYFG